MTPTRKMYTLGGIHVECLACHRWMHFRGSQYSESVICPYPDCMRRYHIHMHLTPATSKAVKGPTAEQIEPTATKLENDD
jgi:hypothetical protein